MLHITIREGKHTVMRYIPTFCLREGMILAKSLYAQDGILLLQEGQKLQQAHIAHLANHGFQGVYIRDKISENIEIKTIIHDELRNSAAKTICEIYTQSMTTGVTLEAIEGAKAVVHSIVEEIIENRNIMVNMIDLKSYDNYTYFHSVNVGVLSIVLGVALEMNQSALYKLGLGALLHDIGKVFIDTKIIDKEGPLTPDEFAEVKKHPGLGYDYLRKVNFGFPASSLNCVFQHHERVDGSGYPKGLVGKQISRFSRIVSVADVYDAMTSDRPYRTAMMPSEVMEYLMGGAGTLFDPEVVFLFTRKVAAFPLGTCVLLSNGMTAIVIENFEDCCLRPKVKILNDSADPTYYDLKNDRSLANITVSRVIKI